MYEKFQEWLSKCPVEVLDYQDYEDHLQIVFDAPLEEDDAADVNKEEQSYVDSLLTSGTDYPPLVDIEATHDSEGC